MYVDTSQPSNGPLQPNGTYLLAVPSMVRKSKRVLEYFDAEQLVDHADSFENRKINKTVCYQSNPTKQSQARGEKRKATTALPPNPTCQKSDYSWNGKE